MTGQEALDKGIVSACNFQPGPVLVKDGVKQTGLGGGVNPRTCIGQREDGTILLMVIIGRKTSSLGATYDDLANLMYEYGAVNASNLDGGSSSLMYYQGEQVTEGSNLIGMRPLPTSILVLE
jgi:exopolysaccharide biosynthesis protein